jgi:hypothetical protein
MQELEVRELLSPSDLLQYPYQRFVREVRFLGDEGWDN